MNRGNRYNRFYSNRYIILAAHVFLIVFVASMFFGTWLMKDDTKKPNMYKVYINEEYVGTVKEKYIAHKCLQIAKENISVDTDEITYVDGNMRLEGVHAIVGVTNSSSKIISRMTTLLSEQIQETLQRSYMLKINDYMVALSSVEEVEQVLQAAVDLYDGDSDFKVHLERDVHRAFNVLTAEVTSDIREDSAGVNRNTAGFTTIESELFDEEYYQEELGFDDFDLGIKKISFQDKVEVTECYLKPSQISDVESAIRYVTENQNKDVIYKVKSGDTLGAISYSTGVPMEQIVAMNDALTSENSTIHVDQELIISMPRPTLTVSCETTEYREEEYNAETIYVDNDEWYTTKKVTLQEPSTGFRKAVSNVVYHNGEEYSVEVLKQEVLMEAVPKIVERGTKIPPTYVKPLYGGWKSSGFGYRDFMGGSYHKGIDWATPTGTTVFASSGGTVTRAGWSSSYGYCVYIQHPGGFETRYAHNSKLLVKVGQTVSQGQSIALSGNTGQSFGAHLHFEIRVNGVAVNPENYLE